MSLKKKKRNQVFLNYPKLCSLNSGGLPQKLFSLVFFFSSSSSCSLSLPPSLWTGFTYPRLPWTHSAPKYEDDHELLILLQQPHHRLKLWLQARATPKPPVILIRTFRKNNFLEGTFNEVQFLWIFVVVCLLFCSFPIVETKGLLFWKIGLSCRGATPLMEVENLRIQLRICRYICTGMFSPWLPSGT